MIIKGLKKYFFTYIVPTFYGGGSGGQNTTVQQRNIPKELLPYYQMMLGASTKQAFTTSADKKQPNVTITPFETPARDYLANPYTPGENNSDRHMGYAKGGSVKHFATGGQPYSDFANAPGFVNLSNSATSNPSLTINGSKLPDVTGIQPFRPYGMDESGNVDFNKYVAPQTALQNQANTAAANLSVPGQGAAATDLSNIAGLGGVNTAAQGLNYGTAGLGFGNTAADIGTSASNTAAQNAELLGNTALAYGRQGAGVGAMSNQLANQAASAGTEYENKILDPETVKAYMNPYLEQSLKPQLALMDQQNAIANQKTNSQAAQAGAYGGSRQMVANNLNDQSNKLAEANLIGQGYKTAYDTALQNMQAGANLGIQGANTANSALNTSLGAANAGLSGVGAATSAGGYGLQGAQTGIQGQSTGIQGAQTGLGGVGAAQAGYGLANTAAGTLGNLGTQQLANQQSIIGTQNQLGTQQQAMGQQAINNAIEANSYQQTYPWQILGGYANALNGVQTGNLTTFNPSPSLWSQGAGALAAGTGAYMANKKKGGVIKAKGSGGIGDLAVYNAMKEGK